MRTPNPSEIANPLPSEVARPPAGLAPLISRPPAQVSACPSKHHPEVLNAMLDRYGVHRDCYPILRGIGDRYNLCLHHIRQVAKCGQRRPSVAWSPIPSGTKIL